MLSTIISVLLAAGFAVAVGFGIYVSINNSKKGVCSGCKGCKIASLCGKKAEK